MRAKLWRYKKSYKYIMKHNSDDLSKLISSTQEM